MIDPKQIPDEVVEAAHEADAACDGKDWMRVAIAAALAEWPGVHTKIYTVGKDHLILPLPKDAADE